MRVLVIGASGFIGRYVMRRLGESSRHDVVGTRWSQPPANDGNRWIHVDLTDAAEMGRAFAEAEPDVVIHLAAIADIGAAERDPERATAVNVSATSNIANLCERHGVRLVFVSTECVFGGDRGFYREDETPNPNTHYGRTKFEAEQLVATLTTPWSVVRTSIVYGWPHPGKRNFAPWLIDNLRGGRPYLASTDVLRTPVYVEHLVDGLVKLVDGDCPGILHIADRDCVSMYDFAIAIADGFGLDTNLVRPLGADDRGRMAGDTRPDRLGLDCADTMRRLEMPHPGLADGVAAMKANAPDR